MKRIETYLPYSITYSVFVFFLALTLGTIFTIFLKTGSNTRHISALTENEMARYVNNVAMAVNENPELKLVLPSQPQQIGTAAEGCDLNTQNCVISNIACLNLTNLLQKESGVFHPMMEGGTQERTLYALWLSSPNELSIKSCAEGSESLLLTRSIE